MKQVDEEERVSVRQKLASDYGFTGLSILHRLFHLYHFNILHDLIFDTMHTLFLRVVKRHLEYYSNNGYLSNNTVEKRLQAMSWTAGCSCSLLVMLVIEQMILQLHTYTIYSYIDLFILEMNDGRIPEGISHKIGYWKAEDYQKFTFPASEIVLGGMLPENHVWVVVVRIVELVFSCGRNGWTQDTLELLENLIWRHNILTEEVEGLQSCVISMHNFIHMPDDIPRFSSPDNYWCFTFERAVHGYIERSSNQKNLELTFAKAESRKELLKFLFDKRGGCDTDDIDYCLETQTVYHASSIELAKQRYIWSFKYNKTNISLREKIHFNSKSFNSKSAI